MRTSLSPFALFLELKKIEFQMGRKKTIVLSDRPIDLDIIFYEDIILDSEVLKIPHPKAFERAFVILPMLDLDPNFKDPLTGKTIYEINESYKDDYKMQKLKVLSKEDF